MTSSTLRVVVPCLVIALGLPALSSAQSLADVARASAATRKEQPKPKPTKVYTNDNLKTDITPSAPGGSTAVATPASPAETATAAPAAVAEAAAPAADGATKDEKYWKERMKGAREALERSTSFAAALQSQINGLTTEFVNRDDPAQRSAIEQRRTKAVAELERVQRETDASRKTIAAIEDEARKAGVPAGWLR